MLWRPLTWSMQPEKLHRCGFYLQMQNKHSTGWTGPLWICPYSILVWKARYCHGSAHSTHSQQLKSGWMARYHCPWQLPKEFVLFLLWSCFYACLETIQNVHGLRLKEAPVQKIVAFAVNLLFFLTFSMTSLPNLMHKVQSAVKLSY